MASPQVTSFGTPAMVRATSGSVTGSVSGLPLHAGDLLVALVTAGGSTASAAAISTPSGWTQQVVTSNVATTANAWVAVYTKIAAGSDSAPAFTATLSGTVAMTVTLFELAAAANLNPVDTYGTYASGGTAGTLTLTATTGGNVSVAGEFAIACFCMERAAATNTWTHGSGWTNAANDGTTNTVLHTAVDYYASPSAGSTLAETGSWATETTAYGAGIILTIAPQLGGIELYANDASTTISSGGTDAPASGTPEFLTAASWSSFPVASNTTVPPTKFHGADPAAPSELFEILNTTTGLVIRGAEGTTPVAHTGGFTIQNVISGGFLGSIAGIPPSGDTTGVTDRANIQGLLNLGGAVQLEPLQTYYVNAPILVPSGAQLYSVSRGMGSDYDNYGLSTLPVIGAVLKATSSFSGVGILDLSNYRNTAQEGGQVIRGITIDGSAISGGSVNGFQCSGAVGAVTVRDLEVHQVPGIGFNLAYDATTTYTPDDWYIEGIKVSGCGGNGISTYAPDCWWMFCESSENTGSNWVNAGDGNSKYYGCKGENSSGGYGFYIYLTSTAPVHYFGCTTQYNNGDGFHITGPGSGVSENPTICSLSGCSSSQDGQGGGGAGIIAYACGGYVMAQDFVTVGATSPAVPAYGAALIGSSLGMDVSGAYLQGATATFTDDGTNTYPLVTTATNAPRGAVTDTEQFVCLSGTYTLSSTTSTQKLFNATANGALTVAGSTTYFFECQFSLSSMSGTSGNTKFDVLGAGSASLTSTAWSAVGMDATTPGTAAAVGGSFTSSNVSSGDIVTAATGTGLYATIKGVLRVNAGGTIIPSVGLTTAAAAIVGVNSFFRCWPIGSNTVTNVGNWS